MTLPDSLGPYDARGVIPTGGQTVVVTASLAVQAAAYADGDLLSAKISLSDAARKDAGSGLIQSVVLSDLAAQNAPIDVVVFNADPSGTTFTLNSALDVADADLPKVVGVVSIVADDYAAFADNSVATKLNVGIPFSLASGTTLYVALVSRGTPTYASTADIGLRLGILRD